MPEAPKPANLLDHLEQRLGPVQRIESGESEAGHRGYDLTFYDNADPPVTTVVTNGLRFQSITSMLPQELVCSLRSDQQHIAHYFVDSMASAAIKHRQGFKYGGVFSNNKPIVEGTQIVGLIGHPSPIHDEAFNLFPSHAAPALQIITLVPVTEYEIDFVKEEGPDELFDVFRLNRTNILDVRRESAV